ncbi:TPA: hypothetical protein N0F65_002532 [Lagenidium giganteum]|uniref:Tyrosinase copper-binding domain-containing protein n=1 Tax=Lagenidium giganteum TaxID=4803 RepID=A0AAV2YK22_9STRA|nr:TPA: hypothetical protein N0F65_002532 [Lagenidium giganteum]
MRIVQILGAIVVSLGVLATPATASSRRLAGGNAACGGARVRKSWANLSGDERQLYLEALDLAIQKGVVSDLAAIHIEDLGETQAHHSCAFFTWHRRMLLAFESYLRDMDPKYACVTLPYYDVHTAYVDAANGRCSNMYECSEIFRDIGGPAKDSEATVVLNGQQASGIKHTGAPFQNSCDDNNECGYVVRNDLSQRPVPSGAGFTAFQDLVASSQDFATFLEGVQYGMHNEVHNAIGGSMSTFASPRDVVFYSWHSAIDMFLYVYHQCHMGVPVSESEMRSSLQAFSQASQTCGGIQGVDAGSEIVMNIRYNGELIKVTDHPALGQYFAQVGDRMWNYGDTQRLDDYSYSYDLPPVFTEQLLSNTDVCRGVQPDNQPTDSPTDAPTDAPVDPQTDAPTDPPTDAPVDPPTDAPVDPQTDAPADPPSDDFRRMLGAMENVTTAPSEKPWAQTDVTNSPAPAISNSTNNTINIGAKKNSTHPARQIDRNSTKPGRGKGHHARNSAYAVKLDGSYWQWMKKTYEGLVKRFDGNMAIVTQQLHVAECMAFNKVFGVREFSDEFVKNFHLTSKRPVCGKQIDKVGEGKVQVAVTTTEFKSQTVEFKSEEVIKAVVQEYKPLAPSQAPLLDPSYVKRAQKKIDSYPTSAPSPKTPSPTSGAPKSPTPGTPNPATPTPATTSPATELPDSLELSAPKKKHSGPRKRRPKKKCPDATAALATCEKSPASLSSRQAETTTTNASSALCASARPFELPLRGASVFQTHRDSSPVLSAMMLEDDDRERDRSYWTQWAIEAAEKERARRLAQLKQLQREEEEEILRRRQWAIAAIEREQEAMMREMFLDNMKNTQWFQSTISRFAVDYEVVCPNSWFGCTVSCMLKDLEPHLECCAYRQVPDTLDQVVDESIVDLNSYDVVCPNAVLGCNEICLRENLAEHLAQCPVNGMSREKELEERQQWRANVILATEEERVRRMDEIKDAGGKGELSFGHLQQLYEEQTAMMHVVLHDEIVDFCAQCQEEAEAVRPWIEKAVDILRQEIRHCWANALVELYGSFATHLHGVFSDVDLIVFGAGTGPTGESRSCQQCVSDLAQHLVDLQSPTFVEISAITRASIPLLKLVVVVMQETDDNTTTQVRIPFDVTFDDPTVDAHNGIASVALVDELSRHFVGLRELTFVLKHFLAKRGLNDPSIGGLSSYGLLLMIVFIMQEHNAIEHIDDQSVSSSTSTSSAAMSDDMDHDQAGQSATSDSCARLLQQRRKGLHIAREVIQHSRQQKENATTSQLRVRKQRSLPSILLAASQEEDEDTTKPFMLGKLLMDFLHYFGTDFRQDVDEIVVLPRSPSLSSISDDGTASALTLDSPVLSACSTTSAHDGSLTIRDPLQLDNNVGKTCYRISQVLRDFSDFLSFLTALIVRGSVMTTGKKKMRVKKPDGTSVTCSSHSSAINQPSTASPTPASSTSVASSSYRILSSVFNMKKSRETRGSIDLGGVATSKMYNKIRSRTESGGM